MIFPKLITGANHALAVGASVATTPAFGAQTYAVRIVSTGACHIEYNGTPSSTTALVAANAPAEYLGVNPGATLSVIQDGSSTGTLHVTELTH